MPNIALFILTATVLGFNPENSGSSSEANNPGFGVDDFAEGFTAGGFTSEGLLWNNTDKKGAFQNSDFHYAHLVVYRSCHNRKLPTVQSHNRLDSDYSNQLNKLRHSFWSNTSKTNHLTHIHLNHFITRKIK